MIEVMAELKPIGELFKLGEYEKALVVLDALWSKIPEPKNDTKNSYRIVAQGALIGLKANKLDKAWEWALRGLPYSGNFNLIGESEFLVGRVAFARGDFENAKKYFYLTYKNSGKRQFKDEDPRYLQLIKETR